ncbi:MAG: hypothetical protein PWP23_1342 [Candidatus Sumerlaeota bacterium]|nr:hypothetical protein [Candidatus Sumerlaeota bacterium]
MPHRFRAGFALLMAAGMFAVAIGLAGCAGSRLEAETIPPEEKAALEIRPGQSRRSVEAVLGIPTAIGPAKGGGSYAQYQFGDVTRSVVYDKDDRVLAAYP